MNSNSYSYSAEAINRRNGGGKALEIATEALNGAAESMKVAKSAVDIAKSANDTAKSKPSEEQVVAICRREIDAASAAVAPPAAAAPSSITLTIPLSHLVNPYEKDSKKMSGMAFKAKWKGAVDRYTTNFFSAINYVLRLPGVYVLNNKIFFEKDALPRLAKKVKSETNYDLADIVDVISSILYGIHCGKIKPHVTKEEGQMLYRAVRDLPIDMEEGSIFCDKAFLSTSKEKGAIAPSKEWKYLFVIDGLSAGYDIEGLSSKPHEKEVFFKPWQMFRICKIEKDVADDVYGTITKIHMVAL